VVPTRKRKFTGSYQEPPDIDPEIYVPQPKIARIVVTGRSVSAPPDGAQLIYLAGTVATPAFHRHVVDITTDAKWNSTKKAIRLAYLAMDPTQPNDMQGLYINDPAIKGHPCTEVPKHLNAVRMAMEANNKQTDATEATGEAAAAFAMCKHPTFSGSVMKWGMHVHSGAGLDQIWHNPTPLPGFPK
jgi:hypothetical protein